MAFAQSSQQFTGTDQSPSWIIDAPKTKTSRKKKSSAPPTAAPAGSADDERAARLAQARKRFFENKPDGQNGQTDSNFTGYNSINRPADEGRGGFSPGAHFQF